MNSTLKIALPLALVVIVIFGVTLISQNVADTSPKEDEDQNSSKISGPPLNIPSTTISYNPTATDIESRSFQAFYELDSTVPISFWFTNTHPVPVYVEAVQRGCTTCTQARIGIVEEESFNTFVRHAAAGSLPTNPFAALNLIPAIAAAQVSTEIKWQPNFDFERLEKRVTIPPGSSQKPVLGVFQMAIRIVAIGASDRRFVDLRAGVENSIPSGYRFAANLFGSQPFEPLDQQIKLPPMNEGAEAKTLQIQVLSATRKLPDAYGSDLPFNPPILAVNPSDPFFEVGKPVPMTEEEILNSRFTLMAAKRLVSVKSGYTIPVTVRRQRPGQTPAEPDIGPFSRDLAISSPGTLYTPTVNVTGAFKGLLNLSDGSNIDLSDFPGKAGTTKVVTVISDNPKATLSWVQEETKPRALDVKFSQPREDSGRRFWDMTITVPPGSILQPLPHDSFVVVKATLPDGTERKIRFPIKGVGFAR
jgi:hypothetical protein